MSQFNSTVMYWTKYKYVCTHFDGFSTLIPNMDMEFEFEYFNFVESWETVLLVYKICMKSVINFLLYIFGKIEKSVSASHMS